MYAKEDGQSTEMRENCTKGCTKVESMYGVGLDNTTTTGEVYMSVLKLKLSNGMLCTIAYEQDAITTYMLSFNLTIAYGLLQAYVISKATILTICSIA